MKWNVPVTCAFVFVGLTSSWGSTLIKGATIVDGTGKPGFIADVRVNGSRIGDVGKLKAKKGEWVINGKGLVLAPGFIDAHSHADSDLAKLESQVRQGITTAIVGQDGYNEEPFGKFVAHLDRSPQMLNFAAFSGHGSLRTAVMGQDFRRVATAKEIARMQALLKRELQKGALGLSTGLEYDPGHYSNTAELISLGQTVNQIGGIYISHVRDEGAHAMDSFSELVSIAKGAQIPAQVSHIKMAVKDMWGHGKQAVAMFDGARKRGLDISADIYPYSFWQSTITALSVSRDWKNPQIWQTALDEVGGPTQVRLTEYSPNPDWKGKTLKQISDETHTAARDLIVQIVEATRDGKGRESILCEAMMEEDIVTFLKWPFTMICSDGHGGGSHPRCAGSFPRIFARYVRERHVLTIEDAVRKMTSLPAQRFGLKNRGVIRRGLFADLVLFDPRTIVDRATAETPTAYSTGIKYVFVNGRAVLAESAVTKQRSGRFVRRNRS